MSYVDLTVRGNDEEELVTALPFLRGVDDADNIIPIWMPNENCMIDILGTPEGTTGFHMNLRCDPGIAAQVPEHIIIPRPANFRKWF